MDDSDYKWTLRAFDLALFVSEWSKDPSTKVGAVIVDDQFRFISLGYNGFPRGVADDERLFNREEKLKLMVHAEVNAINNVRDPRFLQGCYMYVTHVPCDSCARAIIDAGIVRVMALPPDPGMEERWRASYHESRRLFLEAGIQLTLFMGKVPRTEIRGVVH